MFSFHLAHSPLYTLSTNLPCPSFAAKHPQVQVPGKVRSDAHRGHQPVCLGKDAGAGKPQGDQRVQGRSRSQGRGLHDIRLVSKVYEILYRYITITATVLYFWVTSWGI